MNNVINILKATSLFSKHAKASKINDFEKHDEKA